MNETICELLQRGGSSNSLDGVDVVVSLVMNEPDVIKELFLCLYHEDAWVRMRAADSLEKICARNPQYCEPYIDDLLKLVKNTTQPSVCWHAAQILRQVLLTSTQQKVAIEWMITTLSEQKIDWLVAVHTLDSLKYYYSAHAIPSETIISLCNTQLQHTSVVVQKKAQKILAELEH